MRQLSSNVKFARASNAAAAAQTAVNGSGIDTLGFVGIAFLVLVGSIAATGTVSAKLQQSDDNGVADGWSDIADSATDVSADSDDNKMLLLEIWKPRKRYVRVVITRGTADSSIDGIVAMLHGAGSVPVTQDTTVEAVTVLNSPAEGTA